MNSLRKLITVCILIIVSLPVYARESEAKRNPVVLVSITPFYGLVAAVMKGVASPKLLMPAGSSPHHYALRPSELKLLKSADVIIWGGPELESFLVKPLEPGNLKSSTKVMALVKTPDLLLLPVRRNARFEAHEHTHDHTHAHTNASEEIADMHFWLDPDNAAIMVDAIAKLLSERDPAHKDAYLNNAIAFKKQLKIVDKKISEQLSSDKKIPYLVFHDAYQYFDHHYDMNGVGAISLHPEIPPSVQRLRTIQNIIKTTKAQCVFSEPQFPSPLVQSIIAGTKVKTGELDPLGSSTGHPENDYFLLLENLANSLQQCLEKK